MKYWQIYFLWKVYDLLKGEELIIASFSYFPDTRYELPSTEVQQEISATGRAIAGSGPDINLTELTVHHF